MFKDYFLWRENAEKAATPSVTSKIKLDKNNGTTFTPILIDKFQRPNLKLLVRAFNDSDKINLGYKTIEKSKGEVEPTMKKKSLWLSGGSARDHLMGKTPKNNNLSTDATPDEIRLILKNPENKFTEVFPRNAPQEVVKKYSNLPNQTHKNKTFYASKWDKKGKELEITAEINDEVFHIATLTKNLKGKNYIPDGTNFTSSLEEDALGRDFTVNALYILLNNHDGENSDLLDPVGGAHDLKNNELKPLSNFKNKISEDPSLSSRYLKFSGRFNGNLPEDLSKTISSSIDGLDPKNLKDDFVSALEHPDTDVKKFLNTCSSNGLFKKMFSVDDCNCEELPEKMTGDRWMTPAWIMKNHDSNKIKEVLKQNGWNDSEARDISYLVSLYQWAKNNFDPVNFHSMKTTKTGLGTPKIKEWMKIIGQDGNKFQSFISQNDEDLKPLIVVNGRKQINPMYSKHLGRTPLRSEIPELRKYFSNKKFGDSFKD